MPESKRHYIISAADAIYFRSFLQLFYSYMKTGENRNSAFIFYDLGLESSQVRYLEKSLLNSDFPLSYKKFGFDDYPEFVKPRYRTYSWKPIVIHKVFNEVKGSVLWLDSASIILQNLGPVWGIISETGCFTPFSGSGTLREWTVPQTLDYMRVPESWYTIRNRAGSPCGFSYGSRPIRSVIDRWMELALVKECIKPEGAGRHNHRDDQSLLTILLKQAAERDHLKLTDEEVDISSGHPNAYISVRNFVPGAVSPALNFATIPYFKIRRAADIILNRIL